MATTVQPLVKKWFCFSVIENPDPKDPSKIEDLEENLKQMLQGIKLRNGNAWAGISSVKKLPNEKIPV